MICTCMIKHSNYKLKRKQWKYTKSTKFRLINLIVSSVYVTTMEFEAINYLTTL